MYKVLKNALSDDKEILKEIEEEMISLKATLKEKRKAKRKHDSKLRKYEKMMTLEVQKIAEGKTMTMAETTNSIDTAFRDILNLKSFEETFHI